MQRRTFLTGTTMALAVIAVVLVLMVFKIRVAVAGGKYVVMLAVICGVVWVIGRGLRR